MSKVEPREPLDAQRRTELCAAWSQISSPQDLIKEVFQTLGDGVAIGTSGQLSGVTLIDMAAKTGLPFRVFCVDTLRLHDSTYDLWSRLEAYYGLKLEIYRPEEAQVTRMVQQHGEHLFFDNRFKQEHCCNIRKVAPHREALKGMVAWISGLRRDQSAARAASPRCTEVDYEGRTLLGVLSALRPSWPTKAPERGGGGGLTKLKVTTKRNVESTWILSRNNPLRRAPNQRQLRFQALSVGLRRFAGFRLTLRRGVGPFAPD